MRGYENCFNYSMSVTSSTYRILMFFMIIMASTSISDEIQKGILQTILTKRIKRKKLIISKYLFLIIFFSLTLFTVFLLSLAGGTVLFGISDISEKGYIIHSTNSLFLNSFLSIILMLLPMSALISLCLFLSVLFNNNILSLISAFGINFIFYIATELNFYKYIFLTSYLTFPLRVVHLMTQGLPLNWNPEIKFMAFTASIYSILFLTLSIIVFKKKEIP